MQGRENVAITQRSARTARFAGATLIVLMLFGMLAIIPAGVVSSTFKTSPSPNMEYGVFIKVDTKNSYIENKTIMFGVFVAGLDASGVPIRENIEVTISIEGIRNFSGSLAPQSYTYVYLDGLPKGIYTVHVTARWQWSLMDLEFRILVCPQPVPYWLIIDNSGQDLKFEPKDSSGKLFTINIYAVNLNAVEYNQVYSWTGNTSWEFHIQDVSGGFLSDPSPSKYSFVKVDVIDAEGWSNSENSGTPYYYCYVAVEPYATTHLWYSVLLVGVIIFSIWILYRIVVRFHTEKD